MGLPLAGLVAVCLALSSAGGAELRRGEKVVSGMSWEAGRPRQLRAEALLRPASGVHCLGRASCPPTLGGRKEEGRWSWVPVIPLKVIFGPESVAR